MPEVAEKKDKRGVIGAAALGLAALGVFFLTKKGESNPENITLSNLVVNPAQAFINDVVTISVTATNNGSEAATKQVNCEVS